MIDIERVRRDLESVKRSVTAKGSPEADVDALLRADETWRMRTAAVERLRYEHREARERLQADSGKEKSARVYELRTLSDRVREQEAELQKASEERRKLWKQLPNLPLEDAPVGASAKENVVRETPEKLMEYAFTLKDSFDVGTSLGIVDTERAAVASGARFGALVGDGVLLELALVRHAIGVLSSEGFTPLLPPVLIQRERMDAMGYLERGADEVYTTEDNLVLVGTSEQAVGAMHADYEFPEDALPARFVAFSSCFRREAGSHGRDVRGILRVHQFEKVEMFSFCHPTRSRDEHAMFVQLQRRLMDDLKIPYRVVDICTGDMGFAAASQVDLEAWFPARRAFVETHSTSNTTDFQTRRLSTKFRTNAGTRALVHAVNGTAVALQRTIAALLETHQEADGSVRMPDVLRPYLGGRERLTNPRHGS